MLTLFSKHINYLSKNCYMLKLLIYQCVHCNPQAISLLNVLQPFWKFCLNLSVFNIAVEVQTNFAKTVDTTLKI